MSIKFVEPSVHVLSISAPRLPVDEEFNDLMEIDPATYDGGFPMNISEFAGRACYQSFDKPNEATRSNRDYLANILTQQHLSVLEHVSVGFYIQGISRSLTHEFVRHRHFSYSQLSQRYVDSSDVAFVVPPALADDDQAVEYLSSSAKLAVATYEAVVRREMGKGRTRKQAREAARSVLPNMTETKLVVTGNLRSWIEFIVKRDNPAADAEIQRLAKEIRRSLEVFAPQIFDDEARALWDSSFAQRAVQATS